MIDINALSLTVMSMYGLLAQYKVKAEGKRVDSEYEQILIDTLSDLDSSVFTTK